MQPSQWEVIILKPTNIFLAFIASQLPEKQLPELKFLQTDCTAYLIPKQTNDEQTLNEIERHFTRMFRHEISRWLGKDARNEIETNFLDFLCCFKFELHSQILLMESSIDMGHQLLRIKPRSVLLNWMRETVHEQEELIAVLDKVSLANLAENATVVIKNFKSLEEIRPFIREQYKTIFAAEMMRMCEDEEEWPVIDSYQAFGRYFEIEIHTQLIHLYRGA